MNSDAYRQASFTHPLPKHATSPGWKYLTSRIYSSIFLLLVFHIAVQQRELEK
jgi:hypothetical protein